MSTPHDDPKGCQPPREMARLTEDCPGRGDGRKAVEHLDVSVVIPTYQRIDLLCRCLKALAQQDLAAARYEIIVVDDARSDRTRLAVAAFAGREHLSQTIRYLRPPDGSKGPAAARNTGWRAARGAVVAFTDDDAVPLPDWLSAGLHAINTTGAGAAAGRVLVPLPEVPTDWERNTAGLDGAEFVTANCFIRLNALVLSGGFDERFTSAWREDSDIYFTMLERALPVARAPQAMVIHPVRAEGFSISLRQHRKLYFDALLYKKHRQLYRQKIAAGPPWRHYLTVLTLSGALLAALSQRPALAVACFAVWLALTLRFVLLRLHGTSRTLSHVAEMVVTSIAIPFAAVYWRLAGALHFRVPFA